MKVKIFTSPADSASFLEEQINSFLERDGIKTEISDVKFSVSDKDLGGGVLYAMVFYTEYNRNQNSLGFSASFGTKHLGTDQPRGNNYD